MKDTLTINGKKFSKKEWVCNIFDDGIYNYTLYSYTANFKNKTQLSEWYNTVLKSDCFKIFPPIAKNGDRNWESYSENYGFIVRIVDK